MFPSTTSYQTPLSLPSNWIENIYQIDSNSHPKPFLIDIGCAEGLWLIKSSTTSRTSSSSLLSHYHLLGIDIRQRIIDIAKSNQQIAQIPSHQLHFLSTNANVNLGMILREIEKISAVKMITIQFPDPHFKSKHHKRRLINKSFLLTILESLQKNSHFQIFVQSDNLELMNDITQTFQSLEQHFTPSPSYSLTDLSKNSNPFEVPTEREKAYQLRGLPIYRMLYTRTSERGSRLSGADSVSP
jgi:tRNA (guanine-N7-)-methyltransferase